MPDDHDPIRESVAVLQAFFLGEASLEDTLGRLADLACTGVTTADMAGIAMLVDGHIRTVAVSDGALFEIDSVQYESGVGPGVDAFRNQRVGRINIAAPDRIWPALSGRTASYGVLSTMSLPLVAHQTALGVLNLYSRFLPFSADDERWATPFATQAGIALAYWDARHSKEQLETAMRSRAVIEQAKGVLMAGGGISAEEGFRVMVGVSSRENRKLRDIAADIVRDAQQPVPEEATPPDG
jgi:GAF domain-containing protein